MAAPCMAAAASTLKRVGVLWSKVPSGLNDSLRIVTTKQNYISELFQGHQSILDSGIFIKSGTVDKAVLDSILGAAIGLGVAAVGIPVAVGVAGFTGTGIMAGSIAAKMMSTAAIANGGGVAAGGLVATLQSIGAAGVPTAVSAATTATGAVLGALKDVYG
ncbi:interferon alpha-inducible protein 27-like protein 2A isoform X1 [Pantherophis guttatus]|uniref:Interferon alpha-inducible protein 27-like protein 2A isoform X1 n=1 Tax=Pantherophis guttatus TaxID=94885 RepID=A0A6P9BEP8_PANGU|nr:interferon alpha-inducible protein 27-like protein 2A isoform X1 [Pantherophis guttatus]XP_034269288.1 interferon alpha-inducible protein 27-like protein 2A isoform X1 [Pantherophis guttatus]